MNKIPQFGSAKIRIYLEMAKVNLKTCIMHKINNLDISII